MAQEPTKRPRVRCPVCDKAGPANRAGTCPTKGCKGIPVPTPTNAPRSASGEARVRKTVRLLPETAEALTATQVAALADDFAAGRVSTNPLDEPDEIDWCHEDALAFKGHGLDRRLMEAWAKTLGWAGLPEHVEEFRIVKVPDRTDEYGMKWHVSASDRASRYTIAYCKPGSGPAPRLSYSSIVMDQHVAVKDGGSLG